MGRWPRSCTAGPAAAANILEVPNLPPREYVVSGQVVLQSLVGGQSGVVCTPGVDGTGMGGSINLVGSDPGYSLRVTAPISGHFTVLNGTSDLTLTCHTSWLAGTSVTVGGDEWTHMFALRVGDLHRGPLPAHQHGQDRGFSHAA